jgi:predicted ATPase/DNA-binding SARP family transcriptional activator
MAALDYGLLGPLQVRRDGKPLPLGAAKQRALLALLLLHANRVVSSDQLIEALWPKKPPGKPQTAVQGYVSQLRKRLEPERRLGESFRVLVTEAGGYVLKLDAEQLDLERFEHLVGRGNGELTAGRERAAAAMLGEALALFRGPPLADFTYEPWAQSEIGRIEELRLTALEERIEAELALGKQGELTAELETLVAEQPLRERLRGQLMLALYRSGRQAEALEAYQQARTTLVEELGIDPSTELQALYKQILNQDEALAVQAASPKPETNLPTPPTPLVGRERELGQIADLLHRDDVRLLTLTGPGGTGKTRLALQTAAELIEHYPHGVWFVDLAPLSDPHLVLPTIAQTLAVRERPGEALLDTVSDRVADKQMLLLLDNFEHLAEAASLVSRILTRALKIKALVTSRAPLHLTGEREYPVPVLADEEALAVFAQRAQAANPTFALNGNRSTVAEICHRLDNLPLAIELAAAATKILPERALLERLGDRLKLFTAGARDVGERQRTLRATIDWSHELLTAEEKTLFRRLAVFAGGRSLDAIEAICSPEGELNVLEGIAGIVDKSLLRREETPDGEARFVMLETIHEYAHERLVESGEERAIGRRHAKYFLAHLAERAEPELRGSAQRVWLERLELDHDNLRAALSWSREAGDAELGLRLATALWRFWRMHNHLTEGSQVLQTFVQLGEAAPASHRARMLIGASRLAMDEGDRERALARAEEALAAARKSGAAHDIAVATENLGLMMIVMGSTARALVLLEESIARFRALGDSVGTADALNNLANALLATGETGRATEVGDEALALQRNAGNALGTAFVLHTLGYVALHEGDHELSCARLEESLALFRDLGDLSRVGDNLEGLAHIAARRGDYRRAVVLWAAGESIRGEAGKEMEPPEAALHEDALTRARIGIGEPAFAAAWVEGAALSDEQAVAYAFRSGSNASPISRTDAVSSRQEKTPMRLDPAS